MAASGRIGCKALWIFRSAFFYAHFLKGGDTVEALEVQLERVQTAIAAIEGGAQEYQIDNRRLTRANLATLYAREASLMAAIARRDGDNILFANTGRL